MKRIVLVKLLEEDIEVICFVSQDISIEPGQLVEVTNIGDLTTKLTGICSCEPGMVDKKLLKTRSPLQVGYFISAVYHKEYTGSGREDFI